MTDGAGGVPVHHFVSPATSSHRGFEHVASCFPREAEAIVKGVPHALSVEGNGG